MRHMGEVEQVFLSAAEKLAPEVYSDALTSAMKQIGHIGEDALKTFRLILFPLQFTGALQDRLARYIDEAVRKVPEERRVVPQQSMTIQICEKLRTYGEEEDFRSLYINLLARTMDRERVGEAHPAFVNIVTQLAPDEVGVIQQLAEIVEKGTFGRFHVSTRYDDVRRDLTYSEAKAGIEQRDADPALRDLLLKFCVVPERLVQPDLFFVFLEHLVSLGIVQYSNDSSLHKYALMAEKVHLLLQFHCIQLSKFGALFHNACVAVEADPS